MTVGLPAPPALRGARLAGVGAARAGLEVDATALTAPFGKTSQWLGARTGIQALRRLGPGESLLALAESAAELALEDAGRRPCDVDMVLFASCSATPSHGDLSPAALVAARVAPRAVAVDLNAACAGFCYALSAASMHVSTGAARTVLIVGAEQMSRLINPSDLGTSVLFGDGAGAVVVEACEQGSIAPVAWSSDGAGAEVLHIAAGETALRMQGSAVFRWAVGEVHKVASRALTVAGVRAEDIEVFAPHQANARIVEAIAERVGLHNAIVADDVTRAGNTSAASIPLAIDALRASGTRVSGRLALLIGFGAGLSIAAQVAVLP